MSADALTAFNSRVADLRPVSPVNPLAHHILSKDSYAASPDDWCISYWLSATASKSEHTRRTYRKEVTRWRAFLMAIEQDANANDLLGRAQYAHVARFIAWITHADELDIPGFVALRLGLTERQAAKPKSSPVVVRQAVIILHSFYEELSSAFVGGSSPPKPVCVVNPFKPYRRQFPREKNGVRTQSGPDSIGVAKALSRAAWEAVWEAACFVPAGASRGEVAVCARKRLVVAVLRATWERRHAVACITWGDIKRSRAGVLNVRRNSKGQGPLWGPVPDQLQSEIDIFRNTLGRDQTVQPDEFGKSIFWLGARSAGHSGAFSDESIYRIVKDVFKMAADALERAGLINAASELRRGGVGPHTIRHTMATQYLEAGGLVRYAQEALGHSSADITTGTYETRHELSQAFEMGKQWDISSHAANSNEA